MTSTARPRLAFLLLPQFSMMSFSAALEPLRAANRLRDQSLYTWVLASTDGHPVMASNGIPIGVQCSLTHVGRPDLLLVCAGLDPLAIIAGLPQLRGQLRQLASHGCRVGGISSGPFMLAEAGLLNGRRCTVHWEYADLFAERHPQTQPVADLYVVDHNVFTCSGGTAALDLMLHFISEYDGSDLALAVAEQFIHPRIRQHGDQQRMRLDLRHNVAHPKLIKVISQMQQSIANPFSLQQMASQVNLSTRQVERLFAQHLGQSPGLFQLNLRLLHAQHLLRETILSVTDIAAKCSFSSSSQFCRSYRRRFDCSPTAERKLRWSPEIKQTTSRAKPPAR